MSTRIVWLDVAKAWMMLIVLMVHFDAHNLAFPIKGLNFFLGFFMPLFFIASGLTLRGETLSLSFVRSKALRLLLPTLVYGVPLWVQQFFEEGKVDFTQFLATNLWFLPCLFFSLCYVGLFFSLPQKAHKVAYVLLLIVLTVFSERLPWLLPLAMDRALMGALFVLLGYALRHKIVSVVQNKYSPLLFLLCYWPLSYQNRLDTATSVNMSLREYGCWGDFNVLGYWLMGVMGTLFCFSLAYRLKSSWITSRLSWISKNSLRLFCYHMCTIILHRQSVGEHPIAKILLTLFVYLLPFFLAWIMEKLTQRYPQQRWLRYL